MNANKYMNNFKTHHNWRHTDDTRRGHSSKLKLRCRTDRKLYFYSYRVVDWWNKIPQEGTQAPSIDAFKNSLDNHSEDHPASYDVQLSRFGQPSETTNDYILITSSFS